MLGLFPTSHISAASTFNIHILQEVLKPLGRERCMIRIANGQNGKTGAAGRQVSGLRGRMAEVQGYVAACLMWVSVATALGLLRVKFCD